MSHPEKKTDLHFNMMASCLLRDVELPLPEEQSNTYTVPLGENLLETHTQMVSIDMNDLYKTIDSRIIFAML